MLIIENGFYRAILAFALHPVICGVVGNLDNLVDEVIGLHLARESVLVSEVIMDFEPAQHCFFVRHVVVAADRTQAFPFRNAQTDGLG